MEWRDVLGELDPDQLAQATADLIRGGTAFVMFTDGEPPKVIPASEVYAPEGE